MVSINVNIGEAVVNATFDDDQKAMKMSTQLGPWRSNKNFSTAKQVRQVGTFREMVQQLENCHLGPNVKLVEYSIWSQNLLDVTNVRLLLE